MAALEGYQVSERSCREAGGTMEGGDVALLPENPRADS